MSADWKDNSQRDSEGFGAYVTRLRSKLEAITKDWEREKHMKEAQRGYSQEAHRLWHESMDKIMKADPVMAIHDPDPRVDWLMEKMISRAEKAERSNAELMEKIADERDDTCEFCEEGAKCCEKFDNSYGEMLRPVIKVCTPCWNNAQRSLSESCLLNAKLMDFIKSGVECKCDTISDGGWKCPRCELLSLSTRESR